MKIPLPITLDGNNENFKDIEITSKSTYDIWWRIGSKV